MSGRTRLYTSPVRAALLLLLAAAAHAQPGLGPRTEPPLPDTTAARYGTSGALVLGLTEYGFGAGGALRGRLSDDVSLAAELTVGSGRDEREQTFPDGVGGRVTQFKRNYVLLVPLQVGAELRLFRTRVEDNFRPFVHAAAGPALALQWPYFDDVNEDGDRQAGEALLGPLSGLGDAEERLGVGATVAVGAYFGRSRSASTALRFGVQVLHFQTPVDLLVISDRVDDPSRRTFWTPTVSFHVVRLWGRD